MDKHMTEKAYEIMKLAAQVSTTTKADVFVEYSGHVDLLTVRIHPEGFEGDNFKYDFYGNQFDAVSEAKLDDIIDKLRKMLEVA